MSDLIERAEAIKALYKYSFVSKDVIEREIKAIPSADRPQGKWKDRTYGGRILHPWWESCECSQCEEWGSGAWNYCPNCGARMKGADDE